MSPYDDVPEMVDRRLTLVGRRAEIDREIAGVDRALRDLLVIYLAQCAPEMSRIAGWRWGIRAVDQTGVRFAYDGFFLGFDTPGPRELLVPMSWIRSQTSSLLPGLADLANPRAGTPHPADRVTGKPPMV